MTTIECQAGYLGRISTDPIPFADNGAQKGFIRLLKECFDQSSFSDIDFALRPPDSTHIALRQSPHVSSADLHGFLRHLTGNPLQPGLSQRTGLIYANRYAPPYGHVFGVMFDRGFQDVDELPQNATYAARPREGCVVFLDAIASAGAPVSYPNQVLYTTLHELGHLFNLWHEDETPNCMRRSQLLNGYTAQDFRFLQFHQGLLACCSTSRFIHPGGSMFGDRGNLAPTYSRDAFLGRDDAGLRLRIKLEQVEFWPFEPIELDVSIEAPGSGKKQFDVPRSLDPGYDAFTIWIEEPTGEVRRYKPTKYYCGDDARVPIHGKGSYSRDISIFGQSGGYTFRHPGRHRIWAVFSASPRQALRSNVVEVEIKTAMPRSSKFDLRQKIHRSAARAFFYRGGKRSRTEIEALQEIARRFAKEPAGASARYSLGRISLAKATHAKAGRRRQLRREALDQLLRASEHKALSGHRRSKSKSLIGELQSEP